MAAENAQVSPGGSRSQARRIPISWVGVFGVGLWLSGALALSFVTGRVTDWFDMTDELRYERLAISIAQTGSVVPRIHGVIVRDLDQLYPLLIAGFFRHGTVSHDLHQAHVLGAWVMSSACIPAFLLARRVSGKAWVAWTIAVSSVAIPWLIYSSFLLTEVAAYPAFLWAMWALQRTVAAPSISADLLAVAVLVLAFLARTEFLALALVLPLAVVGVEASTPLAKPWSTRAVAALRSSVESHRALAVFYGCLLLALVGFTAAGGHPLNLSAYGRTVPSSLIPPGFTGMFAGYVAQFAFGLALLPFIVGFAWLIANMVAGSSPRDARAFSWVASLSFLLLTAEVTKYAIGWGDVLYERFLFYFAPVMVLAFALAVLDRRWPRWSLVVPLALVCAGFALRLQEPYTWVGARVNADTPVSIFYHPLLELTGSRWGMQVALVAAAIVLTGLFVLASTASRRETLALALIVLTVGLLASETGYVYARLFGTTSYSNRPLTAPIPSSLSWVDAAVGPHANVTVIPFHVSTDYLVNLEYWRDIEFWNTSVDRSVQYPSTAPYDFTGVWFPKTTLFFDPRTGLANISPSPYAVQSIGDSRFQLAGNVQTDNQFGRLIDAGSPWRASFLTFGAYSDGWLRPHAPATIRVFSVPGQRQPRILSLYLQIWAPSNVASRPFTVRSNADRFHGTATNQHTVFVNALAVCVPPGGYADVTIRANGSSAIPGNLSDLDASLRTRLGSIYLADVSVSDSVGRRCVSP
jgi:hypothetical protein